MYFLLAMCLFPEVGYRLVWDKLTGGLTGMPVVAPTAAARCGCPIHRATGPGWGGRLITAIPQWS
jgi:hypothetical protein